MLPTAACHLLPFRSQTSHQLPPLLQSQTPFVSPSIALCYLCSLLSLIYCPLWNTGRVKCKLADQGKQQKTEVKLKTALCYSALSMWGDCAITRHLTPPLKKQRQSTAVAGDRRLCQMAKRRRWSSWQAPVAGVSDKQDPMPVLSPLLCHRRREPALGVVGCFSQNQRHSHYHQCHI